MHSKEKILLIGQALLPENDKPVDAFAAIKAQKQAEPVIDGMILEEA